MSVRLTAWTALRVLNQLRHDRRTIALILVVPSVLLALLCYVFNGRPDIFDQVGLLLLGVFPFTSMFLITSVAMLRERASGTLERLLSMPLHKLDLILGYGIAFAAVAVVQAIVAATVAYELLGLQTQGHVVIVLLIVVSTAVLGSSAGLFTSAFARTEFQALQFAPSVIIPQLLLCGLIWPREEMAAPLRAVSNVVPLRYAAEALDQVGTYPEPTTLLWRDLVVVLAFGVVLLAAGAVTLRRRSS
ncbi:ABC transporter permease [Nocardia jiangxiensis]|uniref:Transport permease protein n=1 Tax=Nocardia jiangxiensis TaxID=282685 RepID=A0ABW6S3L8_9NOCA|nr:ABC transporter permease [Nocardia jiangxiensis]